MANWTFPRLSYMGSIPVAGSDQTKRADFVRAQLERLRGCSRSKPVLLVISLTGVKVCSPDGKSVYMAHALRRISYATCDPAHCQFSFLAREPKGHFSLQYCHSFVTKTAEQVEGWQAPSAPTNLLKSWLSSPRLPQFLT